MLLTEEALEGAYPTYVVGGPIQTHSVLNFLLHLLDSFSNVPHHLYPISFIFKKTQLHKAPVAVKVDLM